MKCEDLMQAIGGIDDTLLEQSEQTTAKRKRKHLRRWGLGLGACLCAAAAAVLLFPKKENDASRWPIREVPLYVSSAENSTIYGNEMVIELRWEDRSITHQFPEASFQGLTYASQSPFFLSEESRLIWVENEAGFLIADTQNESSLEGSIPLGEISSDYLGAQLEAVTLTGYDIYEEMYHETKATLYEIKNISTKFGIAVIFDTQPEHIYVYLNRNYSPETWGQFVDDLDLRNTLVLNHVTYKQYADNGEYRPVVFEQVADSTIWNMLLSNNDLTTGNRDTFQLDVMTIGIDVPLLGFRNIVIGLNPEGYLHTNILSLGNDFFIGTDAVQAFMDYVFENCEGYEIRYVYPTEEPDNGDAKNPDAVISQTTQSHREETVTMTGQVPVETIAEAPFDGVNE